MQAALAHGDIHARHRSTGGDRRHDSEFRTALGNGRDHPDLQAPQGAAQPRDDPAVGREGPADSAGADGAAAAGERGTARGAGAGRPGDRALRLLRGMGAGVVDRPHPRIDGSSPPHRLEDREQAPLMTAPAASDDAALVRAVQASNDRAAFEALVRRHQSAVRTVLRRLTRGDAGLADDLAQETFVLAWRNIRHFRFEARFSTWIYRIAINAWRSEARKKRELLLDLDSEDAPAELGLTEEMPDIVARVDLERAMATLSDGERAAIAACYYADLSHEEAAQALGIPVGTVKTHVLRGKAKLKARLAGKEEKK